MCFRALSRKPNGLVEQLREWSSLQGGDTKLSQNFLLAYPQPQRTLTHL
jgi:hypothetical protein